MPAACRSSGVISQMLFCRRGLKPHPVADAIEPGFDQRSQRHVGTRCGVADAKLEIELLACVLGGCAEDGRDPQGGAAILFCKICPYGRPAIGAQPEIGNDRGRGERSERR